MVHILQKIADWIIEKEERDAEDCTVPDEVVQEWLETVEEHIKHMQEQGKTDSEHYLMLQDLKKKIKHIVNVRQNRCKG